MTFNAWTFLAACVALSPVAGVWYWLGRRTGYDRGWNAAMKFQEDFPGPPVKLSNEWPKDWGQKERRR